MISDELHRILQAKSAIRTAIINKGVSVSKTDKIDTYASKINSITSGGSGSSSSDIVKKFVERNMYSVDIPSGTEFIGAYAFADCSVLSSVSIPDTVTQIMGYAFAYCPNLSSITIPDTVTYMGNNVFYNCTSIQSVTLPNSISNIGWGMFMYCYSLTELTIPSSVTEMSNNIFYQSGVKELICKPTTPPTCSSNTFDYNKIEIIYVPANSVSLYEQANYWSNFTGKLCSKLSNFTVTSIDEATADNVSWSKTNTTIHYTATADGTDDLTGEYVTGAKIIGTCQSETFGQNETYSDVGRTVILDLNGITVALGLTQSHKVNGLIVGDNIIDTTDTTFTKTTIDDRYGVLCPFVPDETREYTFEFTDDIEGGTQLDTFAYFLNDQQDAQIQDDDSSQIGTSDPKFSYECTEGEQYYVFVCTYEQNVEHNIYGKLTIY